MSEVEGDSTHVTLKSLRSKRAVLKGRITCVFKKLDGETVTNVPVLKEMVEGFLSDVVKFDSEINDILCSACDSEGNLDEGVIKELDGQTEYAMSIKTKLAQVKIANAEVASVPVQQPDFALKLPELKCEYFSGEGTTNIQFHAFIAQFDNIIGFRTNLSNATKFTYLKSYLKGYALKLVQHLQISDENYDVALELLANEFLNKEALICDLLKKLLALSIKSDSYLDLKIYLNEVRCLLADLKSYGVDLFAEPAGNTLVSHIILHKLPRAFQQELSRKIGNNYPKIQEVFDNYVDIIQILQIREAPEKVKPKISPNMSNHNKSFFPQGSKSAGAVMHSTLSKTSVKNCKFCTCAGHTMLHCKKYPDYRSRINRCRELKICFACSSQNHCKKDCKKQLDFPCIFCKTNNHISALCASYSPKVETNFCLNSANSGRTFLLPSLTVTLGYGKCKTKVRCLFDTGSQRSYISNKVVDRLKVGNEVLKTDLHISTFIDSEVKSFSEVCLAIDFNEGNRYPIPFLVNEDFNLSFSIDGLKDACRGIKQTYRLADTFDSDEVLLEGLLGVDSIQYLGRCNLVSCMGGKAIELKTGLLPFGNIDSFLDSRQLSSKYCQVSNISVADLTNEAEQATYSEAVDSVTIGSSLVNFVLNPLPTHFDPIGSVVAESLVEPNLDKLFSLESIGIRENSSSYDEEQISKFNSNITLVNGKYNVELAWTDKISEVKSNFYVSKAILDRVTEKLYSTNLYDAYDEVFQQQIHNDILEPISLKDLNVNDHVWVPHRPVIKTAESVTTKLRVVLNCSLKIDNSPSLNKAAYSGIDLMNNLLSLLLRTRANQYFVMSDIKQAFLNIKLSKISDRNKFSILWKTRDGELVAYRYKAIVFGFVSSPFILQNVLKFHLAKYPPDQCNNVLIQNTYVDNVFFTSPDLPTLLNLYRQSLQRLADRGFELRSWVSNSAELRGLFTEEGRGTSHGGDHEKVLGYRFYSDKDKYSLAELEFCPEAPASKRTVLSNIARIFDPLGLTLPILVRGKILLSNIWKAKLDWDEPLGVFNTEWHKIKADLIKLPDLQFPRQAFHGEISLIVFCDSSKQAYGFTCYAKSINATNLLFAKVKIAPVKSKSLPTLELLSVYLALKCLPSILQSVNDAKVLNLTVCVDAQVALSWILTGNVKSKNVFANNRVKEITCFREEILTNHGLKCNFKYVPSELNPADLLTRGISFREFQQKEEFWLKGPFLGVSPLEWPSKSLGCLSEQNKLLTCHSAAISSASILPVNKYSNINKLFRITALVLRFIHRIKKSAIDNSQIDCEAKIYWLRHEQSSHFSGEISFLDNPTSDIPPLVKSLNLFLDNNRLIRCKGRLDRSSLSYEVCNPILLPRNSFLSELVVWDAHQRCKHMGIATTLNFIRKSGWWITKGRSFVKSILNKCITCKKINSPAFRYPKPTDFIRDRVSFNNPYQFTGIDFTGHVFIKHNGSLIKMYILLFTCLNIRSVHLELVPSMSCKDFLLAFIRFCNLHTIPDTIYSDNASTFINGLGILNGSLVDNDFQAYLHKNSIKHVRIPLYSAWAGSYWERMMRVLKSCIAKVIGRKHCNYFEFLTLLTDVQQCINSRPLTYLNEDDLIAITPNSFLKCDTGRSLLFGGAANSELGFPGHKEFVEGLCRREDLLGKFKLLWQEEYLLSLREGSRDIHQADWVDKIAVGDVVLVETPAKPRAMWPMGRVTQLLPGSDGKSRSVKVVRADGTEGVHSIKLLYPLEISLNPTKLPHKEPSLYSSTGSRPPRRQAAKVCIERMRECN